MIFELFQNVFLSIIFIVVVHSIYKYFKNNLTIPKTKDLVNKPSQEYEKIREEINKSQQAVLKKQKNEAEMKNELQSYLKELSNNKTIEPTSSGFDSNFSPSFKSI